MSYGAAADLLRRGLFEEFQVALFNLAHSIMAVKEITLETRKELARDDGELVADHHRPGDWTARGNEVLAPLKHECGVPGNEKREYGSGEPSCGPLRLKERGGAAEEKPKSENEQRCQGNEEAVSE